VVERTLAWITRHRRTVRDYERLPAHHETYVYWAMIIVMTRRLARQPAAASPLPASSNTVRIPNYVRQS
jgi:putative transposase